MINTILVDVDTQHDFCHPHGALFVRGADALASTFRALTETACAHHATIVGSVDSHAFDAWEFADARDTGPNGERPGFPVHCVKGTPGWLKIAGTLAPRARFVPNVRVTNDDLERTFFSSSPQQILLEKEVYSLFANPNADAVLERLVGDSTPRFIVYGVALDYCVKAAAGGVVDWLERAGRRGECWLVRDATAAVDASAAATALEQCAARGVKLVETRDAIAAIRAQ